MVFTDASDKGYGAFAVNRLEKLICSGKFPKADMSTSSTFRELLAVKYALESFGEKLRNESMQINIDNQAAVRILEVGSSKEILHELALQIFSLTLRYNIKF